MHCLLVAATAAEIGPFTDHLAATEKLDYIDMDLDMLITGAGITATTYHLSRYLQHKKPDLVIQAGLAGSFDPTLALGSVLAVSHDVIGDQGVQEKDGFHTIFDLGLAASNHPPYTKGVLPNPNTVLLKRSRLKSRRAVTVNEITTSKKRGDYYLRQYKASLESMEGAALHFVCLSENISFLQIRSLSNYVGERNKKKWAIPQAIQNLNTELIRLLESL